MTPDNELPIWPFQPNWREAITERLTWLSGVLTSDTGAVQSFSARLSPRREFEALFNPVGDERTFFDLFLSELGRQEMMIPLWHDRHKLTSAVEDGDNRIDCDTEYGEFMDGGMALLIGDDPWSHQAVEIDEVDETGFTLAVAADFDWPVNGVILPLRRSRIDLQPSLTNFTGAVGNTTLRFALNQANEIPDYGAWDGLMLDGYPVLTTPTNWREQVEMEFSGITETEDNNTGLTFIRDIADRAFRTKNHLWMLRGRQENWEFRQFLYRMGGRRNPVYIPTGTQDMVVATDAAAGANNVQVRRVGLTYIGGPQPGRDRFLVKTTEGTQARRITGLGVPSLTFYEKLNLNAVLTYALPAGSELSFLEAMRADGDSIELQHHTDTEGLTECSINFRSFSDTRNGAGSNFVDYPTGVIEMTGCGVPDGGVGPCMPPVFEFWYAKATLRFLNPTPGVDFSDCGWTFRPRTDTEDLLSIWYTDSANYPGGIPRKVYDPDNLGLTVYWITPAIMDATKLQLSIQFGFGSAGPGMQGYFTWQFWDKGAIAPLPVPPSDSVGNPFTVRSLWPDSWYFEGLQG
jgi:hypothetical protein